RFVLATNIDILFSDELMAFVAGQRLDPGRVYRVDRIDVPAEIDASWPMEMQLDFWRTKAVRVNHYDSTVDLLTGQRYRIYRDVPLLLRVLPDSVVARTHLSRYLLWRIYAFAYWLVAGFNQPRRVPARIRSRVRRLAAYASVSPRGVADDGAPRSGGAPAARSTWALIAALARASLTALRGRRE